MNSMIIYRSFSPNQGHPKKHLTYPKKTSLSPFFLFHFGPSADLGCGSQCLGAQERVVPQFRRQDGGVGCHAATLRNRTGGARHSRHLSGIIKWDPNLGGGGDQTLWISIVEF